MLLGRSYVSLERYADALKAYRRAYELSGGNDLTAALGYAEAMALGDRSTLAGAAGDIIDAALETAPQNPKALWYGGLSAVARGDTDTAAERWQRLLNQALPDEVRQIVQQQLASLGVGAGPSSAPAAAPAIQISVSVAPALLEQIDPAAPLFIVARHPSHPGPPVAVVRQTAGQLPAVIEITNANLMLPGGSLADHRQLRLIARVARGGDAIAQPGDVFGETVWNASAADGTALSIVIDSVVE